MMVAIDILQDARDRCLHANKGFLGYVVSTLALMVLVRSAQMAYKHVRHGRSGETWIDDVGINKMKTLAL